MSRAGAIALAAVLLGAIIGFPLGMDQGMFVHCARVLNEGGTLYVDAYDVKPPAIHSLYAMALWLPFSPEMAVRLFEFAWNLLTCFALWQALQAWAPTVRVSAVLVFAGIMVASGHPNTAQPETFAALPFAALLWAVNQPPRVRMLVYGIAGGLAIGLKPTMALAGIPLLLLERSRLPTAYLFVVPILAMLTAGVTVVPVLVQPDGLDALRLMVEAQVAFGASTHSLVTTYVSGLTATARWFTLSVGLPIVVMAVIAYRRSRMLAEVRLATWLLLALFVSVIIEHRFPPYHLLRMAAPLAFLAAIGLGHVLEFVHQRRYALSRGWRILSIGTAVIALATTCLPLAAHKVVLGYGQQLGFNTYGTYLARRGHEGDDVLAFRRVANAINSHSPARPIVLSVRAGSVLPWIQEWRFSRAASTQFVTGLATPPAWIQAVRADVAQATLLAIDTADVVPMLTGHHHSTLRALQSTPDVAAILSKRFAAVDTVHTFVILIANS